MKTDKDKWVEDVFDSMKGSEPAKVPVDLYAKIQAEIFEDKTKVIPLYYWRYAAAAAVLVLLMNVFSVIQYKGSLNNSTVNSTSVYEQPLMNAYQIYE